MQFLADLWLPIVVSAVLVWIASFFMHMVLPHHKGEYKGLPDEEKFYAGLEGVQPGWYMFPWGTMADMKNPEFVEKQKRVHNGTLIVWPGPVDMGRNLMLTLLFYVFVGVFVAYIGSHSIPAGSDYLHRFRICGAVAFAAHGLGWMSYAIWYRNIAFWSDLFDAIVYAVLTAGTFAWLWR